MNFVKHKYIKPYTILFINFIIQFITWLLCVIFQQLKMQKLLNQNIQIGRKQKEAKEKFCSKKALSYVMKR